MIFFWRGVYLDRVQIITLKWSLPFHIGFGVRYYLLQWIVIMILITIGIRHLIFINFFRIVFLYRMVFLLVRNHYWLLFLILRLISCFRFWSWSFLIIFKLCLFYALIRTFFILRATLIFLKISLPLKWKWPFFIFTQVFSILSAISLTWFRLF